MALLKSTKATARAPKPRITAKPNSKPQKPVKTPMKVADRKARVSKAAAMNRSGAKGPALYKSGGGNTKKR
jgi:hypothetical protein